MEVKFLLDLALRKQFQPLYTMIKDLNQHVGQLFPATDSFKLKEKQNTQN